MLLSGYEAFRPPVSTGFQECRSALQERRLRLLLARRSGTGKSATGSSLLQRKHFLFRLAAMAVTSACTTGSCRWASWDVEVLDTPDLFSPEVAQADPDCEEAAATCCRPWAPRRAPGDPVRPLHRPGPAGLARGEGALQGGHRGARLRGLHP